MPLSTLLRKARYSVPASVYTVLWYLARARALKDRINGSGPRSSRRYPIIRIINHYFVRRAYLFVRRRKEARGEREIYMYVRPIAVLGSAEPGCTPLTDDGAEEDNRVWAFRKHYASRSKRIFHSLPILIFKEVTYGSLENKERRVPPSTGSTDVCFFLFVFFFLYIENEILIFICAKFRDTLSNLIMKNN